jgi:DNA-binding transcriptional regulator YiaG
VIAGKLPRIAEVMKFDSFRTYLNLLESLGKRLDPGMVQEFSLHSLRKKKGLSQSQLALSLGVSRNRVANWESGRSEIPDDVLKKLS